MLASYAGGEAGARWAAREGAAVVVMDAFRASTTIAILVSRGAWVVPVASVDEAAAYVGVDYRIGERGSTKLQDFDFGNSPAEVRSANLKPESTVVLTTTNGTRVTRAARGAPAILTGAFINAHAVADNLANEALEFGERVAVVGCGWEGSRASEDESASGAILHRLRERGFGLDERAEIVVGRYLERPKEALRRNTAARRLMALGYEQDLDFCLTENTVPVAPRLVGDAFVGGSPGDER